MPHLLSKIFLLTLLIFHTSIALSTNNPNDLSKQQWLSKEYEKFIIHYPKIAEQNVDTYAKWYQHFYPKHQAFFRWTPKEKFHVSLVNNFDVFNGSSTPFPFNSNRLFLTIYDEMGALLDRQSQTRGLVNHELVHLFHIDKNSGNSQLLRNILGRNFFTFPASFQPILFIEGLAVYLETDKKQGFGRGGNSWYPARMRMETLKGLPNKINPFLNPGTYNPYLYGYYFYEYLAEKYGEQAIQRWITTYSNNIIPFRIDSNTKHLGGHSLDFEWANFIHWLNQKFSTQITDLRQPKELIKPIFNSSSEKHNQPFFINPNEIIYFQDNGDLPPTLIKHNLKNQKQQTWYSFDDTSTGYGIDSIRYEYHPQYGLLFTQASICIDDGLRFDLYHLNIHTKKTTQITQCQSIRRAIWDEKGGIIAIQSTLLKSKLLYGLSTDPRKFNPHKITFSKLLDIPYDGVMESLDIADNQLAASIKKTPQGYNLYQATLYYKNNSQSAPTLSKLTPLIENFNQNLRVRFDAQNNLHYISDQNNVFNLYRYDQKTKKSYQLTHTIGGIVDYDILPSTKTNHFVVSQFAPSGFNSGYFHTSTTTSKPQNHNIKSTQNIDFNHTSELGKQQITNTTQRPYSPLNTLKPTNWLPVLSSSIDGGSFYGLQTYGEDALGFHTYQLVATLYNYQNYFALSGFLQYLYDQRWSINARQLPERIDDQENGKSNPQIKILRELSFNLLHPLTAKLHQKFGLSHQQHDYFKDTKKSNVLLKEDRQQTYVGTNLQYRNLLQWQKQMFPHQGYKIALGIDSLINRKKEEPSQLFSANLKFFLPIGTHSAFAFADFAKDLKETNSIGIREYETAVAVGNRSYQFKGSQAISTINANQLQKFHLGWQSAAKIIDYGFYLPPIGLSKLSLQTKAGTLQLQTFDKKEKQTLYNYEFNLLFDINIGYIYKLPLLLGYAKGWTEDEKQNSENFSLSLNLPM
jgi:hypothetical protein